MKIESYREKNEKKKFIIIFTVICMILVVAVFLYHSYAWYESEKIFNSFSGNVTPVGDTYFSIYVDGMAVENLPGSDSGYNFNHATCTNGATATWDDTSWAPTINNLTTSRTKCTLYFEEDRRAATIIKNLVGNADPTSIEEINNGTDQSGCTNTLAYDDYGNLRYVGSNPCNYVTFNDESAGWRIIGSFDGYVKIIRIDSIGEFAWDTSAQNINGGRGINQWGASGTYDGADIMKLLNPGYDNNLIEDSSGNVISGTYVNNSLYWNRASGNCYSAINNANVVCDFTSIGLTDYYKSLIDYHTWYLGSQGTNSITTSGNGLAKKFYEYERSNNTGKSCTSGTYCNDTVTRTTTWEGYIGLMYPSDFGYAIGGESRIDCLTNVNLSDYDSSACGLENDWLYDMRMYQATMMPRAESSRAYYLYELSSGANIVESNGSSRNSKRPTLYLKSSVAITGGNGTSTNPYTLSYNE